MVVLMQPAPNLEFTRRNASGTDVIAPTQSVSTGRLVAFWIAVVAGVIVALVLLRAILLPFVAGMLLAYLLDPIATWLERHGMNRLAATLIIVGCFFGCIAVVVVLATPLIVSEVA